MKVSIVSVLLVLLLFSAESSAQFTKYRAKDYVTNATTYARDNYSPNAAMYAITSFTGLDSTYSSGIYFCKLESKDYSQTRKMKLIK
jgi:hypothetical protein